MGGGGEGKDIPEGCQSCPGEGNAAEENVFWFEPRCEPGAEDGEHDDRKGHGQKGDAGFIRACTRDDLIEQGEDEDKTGCNKFLSDADNIPGKKGTFRNDGHIHQDTFCLPDLPPLPEVKPEKKDDPSGDEEGNDPPFCRLFDQEDPKNQGNEAENREERSPNIKALPGCCRAGLLQHPMESKDDEKDDQLEGKSPPPGVESGQVSAENKAKDAGHRGDPAPDTEGKCPFFPLVGPGNERYRCREHQHRADPFKDRPAYEEHGCVMADCSRKSPDAINHSTDHERPLPPDEVLELCPDQHEGSLHQGIDGDDGLDG